MADWQEYQEEAAGFFRSLLRRAPHATFDHFPPFLSARRAHVQSHRLGRF